MNFKFKRGFKAKDIITGFKGIITGRADYLTGCNQYLLVPKAVDNESKEGYWCDEQRIELCSDHAVINLENEEPGSDISPLKRR